MKKPFSKTQNVILTEIYRRLIYFHKGDLLEKLLITLLPSESKYLRENGYIRITNGNLRPRQSDWYCLTKKGRDLFRPYCNDKLSDFENNRLYVGDRIKTFFIE